jgi:hypothetical protein
VHGRFQYRIEVTGRADLLTSDPSEAEAMLRLLGVSDGARLIVHVREWGSIEIIPGSAQS